MPKMKTHKGTKKRFRLSATGIAMHHAVPAPATWPRGCRRSGSATRADFGHHEDRVEADCQATLRHTATKKLAGRGTTAGRNAPFARRRCDITVRSRTSSLRTGQYNAAVQERKFCPAGR